MLLIDGVRYHLHKFKEERELEDIVEEHAKDIFGEESIYFGKKKISSLSGIGSIPDGYVITFGDTPRWYVVEVELSSHDIFNHIVPQISKFINGIKSDMTKRELINYMDKEIRSQVIAQHLIKERFGEVYRFLFDLVYKSPIILIVIDEKTKELDDVVSSIPAETKVLEFRTFESEKVGIDVHAHTFDPIISLKTTVPYLIPTSEKPQKSPITTSMTSSEVRAGDFLDIPIRRPSYRESAFFRIPLKYRRFFPAYKIDFILETDIGDITTKVMRAAKGTNPKMGDPNGGTQVRGGLRAWYEKHTEVTVGNKVRFECIEPYKRYRLSVV